MQVSESLRRPKYMMKLTGPSLLGKWDGLQNLYISHLDLYLIGNFIYNYQSEAVKTKRIYEETEIQHDHDNGTMIRQEENVAMSVNAISNGITTIRIVPHH